VAGLPAPVSPAAYFEGWGRTHCCVPDNILLFARRDAADLQRRSAESHLHRRFLLCVCLETAGTVTVDGVPFALDPGHAMLVFPQSYHHFSQVAQRSLLWLMVTFETTEPERLAVLRQRTLSLEDADLNDLSSLVSRFSGGDRRGRGDALSIGLTHLLCRLCERAGKEDPAARGLSPRRLTGLWDRLQVQLEGLAPEDLRIAPLAARLRISERHLRQKFKEQFGVSLGSYLRNYRIHRAIGLLMSSDLSLGEIADRCGYQSSASFHRAFRSHTGVAPSRFRQPPDSLTPGE
jgi:AraC-like DNA-binding protein